MARQAKKAKNIRPGDKQQIVRWVKEVTFRADDSVEVLWSDDTREVQQSENAINVDVIDDAPDVDPAQPAP